MNWTFTKFSEFITISFFQEASVRIEGLQAEIASLTQTNKSLSVTTQNCQQELEKQKLENRSFDKTTQFRLSRK